MTCPNCGGTMLGDGYSVPRHCENADVPLVAPDSAPTFCKRRLTKDQRYKCPLGHEKDKYGGACPICAKAWKDFTKAKQGGTEL